MRGPLLLAAILMLIPLADAMPWVVESGISIATQGSNEYWSFIGKGIFPTQDMTDHVEIRLEIDHGAPTDQLVLVYPAWDQDRSATATMDSPAVVQASFPTSSDGYFWVQGASVASHAVYRWSITDLPG